MRILALVPAIAVTLAGCAMGTPASIAPASRQAMEPVQTFGFNPVVQQGLTIPVDAAGCIVETGFKVVEDLKDGAKCVIRTLFPAVVPPEAPQAAPQSAPCAPTPKYVPAPAPKSTPVCQNGACAVGR